MSKKYLALLVLLPPVVIADQLTKLYVDGEMRLYQSIEVLENFFHFTYVRNKGAAFGIFSGANEAYRTPFFLTTTAIAIVVILVMLYRYREEALIFPVSLSLILGGAVGNMIDRVRFGEVIDFIDVHWYQYHWPAFNIADMAITGGVGLLILHMFTEERED